MKKQTIKQNIVFFQKELWFCIKFCNPSSTPPAKSERNNEQLPHAAIKSKLYILASGLSGEELGKLFSSAIKPAI